MEYVVLVDEMDNEIGTMEKMEAHRKGALHRAFSVLVFNSNGQMLIQKRATSKYHSPGLWTNACCSHPRPNENILEAGKRRLREEMGIDAHPEFVYKFTYKTIFSENLIEHEVDHVLLVTFDGVPSANPDEASDSKFVRVDELRRDAVNNPALYTTWFRIILSQWHPGLPTW